MAAAARVMFGADAVASGARDTRIARHTGQPPRQRRALTEQEARSGWEHHTGRELDADEIVQRLAEPREP